MRNYILILLLIFSGCTSPQTRRIVQLTSSLENTDQAFEINKELIQIGAPAVPHVIGLLDSSVPKARLNAAWILSEISDLRAQQPLLGCLSADPNPDVRDFCAQAFQPLGTPSIIPDLERILSNEEDPNVRKSIQWSIKFIKKNHKNPNIQVEATGLQPSAESGTSP